MSDTNSEIYNLDELKHIRRGHAARVTAVCNNAVCEISTLRSKGKLSKTLEQLETSLKSLQGAHACYIETVDADHFQCEQEWFDNRFAAANNVIEKIAEYLTRTDVKSVSVISSIKSPVPEHKFVGPIRTEQLKLQTTHSQENKQLMTQINELQIQQKQQQERHAKEIAELEKHVYRDVMSDIKEEQHSVHSVPPDKHAYVRDWLTANEEQKHNLNPFAKPFVQIEETVKAQAGQPMYEYAQQQKKVSIDSWIDDLVIGQETVLDNTYAEDNLAQTLVKLESERNLPKIDLPTFNGDPISWPRFIEQFYVQIHCRPGITDTRRMDLMQSHVEGEAKRLIQGLGYSGQNYALALKELKCSFGHRIRVCRAVIDNVASGGQIPSRDPTALRRFYVAIRDCITTLQQLDYLSDLNSSDIVLKVSKRLPFDKIPKWNEFVKNIVTTRDPNLIDLQNWLRDRVEADFNPFAITITGERGKSDKHNKFEKQTQDKKYVRNQSAKSQVSDSVQTHQRYSYAKTPCAMCGDAHYLYRCPLFSNKTVAERKQIVQEHRLCFNCLKPSHQAIKCFSTVTCQEKNCDKRHHTMLHEPPSEPVHVHSNKMQTQRTTVFLQLVPIHAYGPNGRIIKTFALLDSGSDVTLIHKDLAKDLGLKGQRRRLRVKTYNGVSTENSFKVTLNIESATELDSRRLSIKEAWTVDASAFYCLPQQISPDWEHLKNLGLPDIDSSQVKMLIGIDVPEAHLQKDIIRGNENQPIAVKTILGWSLMGVVDDHNQQHETRQARINFVMARDQQLSDQLEQFWKTESFGVTHNKTSPYSVEDEKARHILETTTKLVNNHYEIGMLWRDDSALPNNVKAADRRFRLINRRITKDLVFGGTYTQTLNSYISNGHAEKMDSPENSHPRTWYLPHHGVTNPNKPGKVRVVFDAAASYQGTSLNDKLMTGPDLVNSLFGIIQRFRLYSIAICADIEGMYHQVRVPEQDSDSLRFLWKCEPKKPGPPDVYRMKVHIFGAADSSSCANYAVKQTAQDNADKFDPSVVNTALNDFYVDDLLKSVESESRAISLIKDITQLMQLGGFHLHKWVSNSQHVLDSVAASERAPTTKNLDLDDMPVVRALGLKWNTRTDSFMFEHKPQSISNTKRSVVSTVSSIFDPCGYLAPFTIRAKCFVQELWKERIDWDDELPPDLQSLWNVWLYELRHLSLFNLPRHHRDFSSRASNIIIHVFADASERCFGACAYLCYTKPENTERVCSFLAAKTRVAPIKPQLTIPRLELQGAVLAVRLRLSLEDELAIPVTKTVYWTDSNTVLQYLNNTTRRFKPFVANRVSEILNSTEPNHWRHVPSELNPADYCSRGLPAKKLTPGHPWLQGPSFITKGEHDWPKQQHFSDDFIDESEVKKCVFMTSKFTTSDNDIESQPLRRHHISKLLNPTRYSRWLKLCRVSAWVLRAAKNFLSKLKHNDMKPCIEETLTVSECEEALLIWVQEAQQSTFSSEISCFESNDDLSLKSPLLPLSPIFDGRHLRVGGRLRKADIPLEAKYQLLLPEHHPVTQLLMDDIHRRNAHCGPEHIISTMRQRFWPVRARKLAKRVIRNCRECRKRFVKPNVPKMADLPKCRVQLSNGVFSHSGVDYFGPITVKIKRSSVKRWGCLFTCLATRAVHIELADSLETDDFILALRNFIARRGQPLHIYSDNGTNFHGANNELKRCLQNLRQIQIKEFLNVREIQWHFNPPSSPHFGGAWERLVRSVKTALNSVLKDKCLHESVLRTSLTEVEAILNSRPLTYNSTSPSDFTALTPNHFLLGKANPCYPVDCFDDRELCSRKRWRQAQVIADHVNRRWLKEFLPTLTIRHRWRKGDNNISVGNLVLLVDNSKPRGQWELGRITNILPGDDGSVRTIQVKTPKGEYTRPAVKVCVLEETVTS